MNDKYATLSLIQLKELAKSQGVKNVSTMRKAQLVQLMGELEEKYNREKTSKNKDSEKTPVSTERTDLRSERGPETSDDGEIRMDSSLEALDSGQMACGILEVLSDGYGFIRCENYLPGPNDVYVSPAQIRRFNMKTGDIIGGNIRVKTQNEKFSALLYVKSVNGFHPAEATRRMNFEDMTPVFPDERIRLETVRSGIPMRIMDLVSPIGKGQRGMIVSPPKTGKTTLLKQIAKAVTVNNPDMNLIILLIDERPEEVTDIRESIVGENVEVIYSTFDELPEHHKRVSEMVLERAKRLVEHKKDVVILLDSITRLARAYNLTVPPSGRTLSGGLDPAALHMPKKFFGAARNMREGGSLTVLATAQEVRWTMSYSRNLREPVTWNWSLTGNFQKNGYSRRWIFCGREPGGKNCFFLKKNWRHPIRCVRL